MKRVLSKHGRARFIERLGYMSDKEIKFVATHGRPGYIFKWKPKNGKLVLVTVLYDVPKLWLLTPAQLGAETIRVEPYTRRNRR